ncbi:site-specific integrase [Alisedimentitalea sp. MJ-SS2]|uniref:site-specific integrase n=1 Tax=Aliisedimentitalea sp. MJ-SS2 TaxID=3049795 RepID=UPI0029099EF5|nr:site-specific integrase [Alisedimentitalea sp. MJ-SS2]MDU8927675.1 site-specific integrase [Alisedimentitalea sp. MJ-SS2]
MSDLPRKTGRAQLPSTEVKDLLEAAYAANTRRAYRSDIASFLEWGGSIPSTPEEIAAFIAFRANNCTVATIRRQMAALSSLHTSLGYLPNPLKSRLIASTMRGLDRIHGQPQRAVEPLLIEQLRLILDGMPASPVGKRDAALLTIGFAGAMRRSELVGIDFEDIDVVSAGIRIMIRRSKIDQSGRGRIIAVPRGWTRYCPIRYLEAWTDELADQEGAVFRSCSKGGRVNSARLSVEAVATIVKRHVERIGLNPTKYSGHSLRAGYVTSAVQVGAAEHSIRKQTGHASSATMERYIRLANLFEDNPTGLMF